MNEITNQEIKELILSLDKKFEVKFAEMQGHINQVEASLKGEIKHLDEKLTGQINLVDQKLSGQINRVEATLKGEINKGEAKLDGIDKRLGNEEIVSRSAFIGILLALLTGMTKFLFFPDKA